MRRRIIAAMLGVVAGALLVAGAGSLVFVRFFDLRNASHDIRTEAQSLAAVLGSQQATPVGAQTAACRDILLVAGTARVFVGEVGLLAEHPGGTLGPLLPAGAQAPRCGLTANATSVLDTGSADGLALLTARDETALGQGRAIDGVHGSKAYAASPVSLPELTLTKLHVPVGTTVLVVLTTTVNLPLGSGVYLLFGSGLSLIAAAAVAVFLARRISAPIAVAARTTGRIAAGDLDARVPVAPTDPLELAQLGEAINAMAAALSASRGLERQFLLSISHDLRTPLTSIRGYGEAIAEGAAPDPAKAAGVIVAEARRLERLFQDLLDLARLDARRFAIDVRPVDAGEVVQGAAAGMGLALSESGIELTVQTPPSPVLVDADPDRLAQVVANLVENASKFAHSRVRVAIGASKEDSSSATIIVEDDGPGIAPEDLSHVFERFYMSERRPAANKRGIGLGLAIVGELTHAMGGEVEALSPVAGAGDGPGAGQGGTRMVVRLRRSQVLLAGRTDDQRRVAEKDQPSDHHDD
ncbi:MAG TPA: HAMP domain-containing sensor histidine kinase [Acidimicrobiales bacterium]|nr:HAMP domain-containing sensor histidine kinase [Acidimicrobiales bacterium]